MGQRHNRRRTRSRPRNRCNHQRDASVDSHASSTVPIPHPQHRFSNNPPASHWHQQYSAWQARAQLQFQQERALEEAQRLRLFGGEIGDETSLCAPMLKVVMDLFDDIDYVDP